jgi:threonine synthase
MRYVSTRGQAPELGFADVLLAGLATDGGLYMPQYVPTLPPLSAGSSYSTTAAEVMLPFVGDDIAPDVLRQRCDESYATFRHPAVCPLVQTGANEWVLELFHGPTLAFKDVALQLVGRLFDHVLSARNERVTILGATSGDTGTAAIEGVKSCANVDIVILYPHGRVSDVQRRQMTTVNAPNVRTVAIEGTFDDCQDLVKAAFADAAFRERMHLSAVNSINWARVMAQIVYYVTASQSLGGRPVRFTVPTGNFGNVLAGWIAEEMGLPVEKFIIASNTNDILTRTLRTGIMSTNGVVPTLSPSMDIQVSSNFERLLFELNGRDGGMTADQMRQFRTSGATRLEADQQHELSSRFSAHRVDDDGTLAIMRDVYAESGMLLDPHTAVGVGASRALASSGQGGPEVILATAHPAKFPDAVVKATRIHPPLPAHLADLFDRPEQTTLLPNDLAEVQRFVSTTFV